MKKILESFRVTKNKTSNLIIKTKNIVIIAIFLLLCIFSNSAEARGEVPEDIIQAKENVMNEIALGASNGITLTRTYNSNNGSISLTWNAVEGASKYKIYQAKEGEGETLIATVQATEVNLNKANAGIKDTTPPTMPKVTAVSSTEGNSIAITPSEDKGTTYRHRVVQQRKTISNADIIFLIDLSSSMSRAGFVSMFQSEDGPIITIAQELLNRGMRVGTIVMANSDSEQIKGPFTTNMNDIRKYVNQFEWRRSQQFANGINTSIQMFKNTGKSDNKIIILFTDNESDDEHNNGENEIIKRQALKNMQNNGIKLYAVYRDNSSYVKDYCDGYIVQPSANKEKQVEAFNTIFEQILSDIGYESNTVSTTVTSGIQGYQYAITTSSSHTFTNEEVVPLDKIPTFVSGEEQMVQYLHIRAVDKAGNPSDTQSILLQVPAKITLKSNYEYGMNYVPLSWINNDTRSGYVYRLYQKAEGENTFNQISSSNSVEQRIYKDEWSTPTKYTTPGTYIYTVPDGITRIKVAVVGGGGRRGNGI